MQLPELLVHVSFQKIAGVKGAVVNAIHGFGLANALFRTGFFSFPSFPNC